MSERLVRVELVGGPSDGTQWECVAPPVDPSGADRARLFLAMAGLSPGVEHEYEAARYESEFRGGVERLVYVGWRHKGEDVKPGCCVVCGRAVDGNKRFGGGHHCWRCWLGIGKKG